MLTRCIFTFFKVLVGLSLASCGPSHQGEGENLPHISDPQNDPTASQQMREQNKALVKRLAVNFEEGRVYPVKGISPSQCGGTSHNYTIEKKNDEINVNLDLALIYGGEVPTYTAGEVASSDGPWNNTDKAAAQKVMSACDKHLKEFWIRNGIRFNVGFRFLESQPATGSSYHATVNLIKQSCRSNAKTYCLSENVMENPAEFCGTFIHEVGHLVGLADEYHEDGTCREEKYSQTAESTPYNFMAAVHHETTYLEPYPRNVFSILQNALSPEYSLKVDVTLKLARLDKEILLDTAMLPFVGVHSDLTRRTVIQTQNQARDFGKHSKDSCKILFSTPQTGFLNFFSRLTGANSHLPDQRLSLPFNYFDNMGTFEKISSSSPDEIMLFSAKSADVMRCQGSAADISSFLREGITDLIEVRSPSNFFVILPESVYEFSLYDQVRYQDKIDTYFKQNLVNP